MKGSSFIAVCIAGWFVLSSMFSATGQSTDSTVAIQAIEQATESYYYGDFAKALIEARTAYGLLLDLDPPLFTKEIEAKMLLAKCYVFVEQIDSAIYHLRETEDRLRAQPTLDTSLLASVYGLRSHAHDRASELKLAMKYGKQSLEWGKQMRPQHPKLGDFYHGLANVYFSLGDYRASYDFYQLAVDFYLLTQQANDPTVPGNTYGKIVRAGTQWRYRSGPHRNG